jgi:methyl-accepting chemotaxis protein
MKIKLLYKLIILIAIPLLTLGVSTYISFKDINSVSHGLTAALYEQSFKSSALVLSADRDLQQARIGIEVLYRNLSAENHNESQQMIILYKEKIGQVRDQVAQAQVLMSKNIFMFKQVNKDSGLTAAQHFSNFDTTFRDWLRIADPLVKDLISQKNEPASVAQKYNQVMAGFDISRADLSKLSELIDDYAKSEIAAYRNQMNLMLFLNLFGIIMTFVLSFIIARSITGPLNKIIRSLSEGVYQVNQASIELSASSQQLSDGSSEQASSIEETSATLDVSALMLQQNAANTVQASELSEQAKESADKGGVEMQEMMGSMQEIKKSSNQIARIIKVIDDIAFQTNILALNAAIEAARAGEAGLGFAVVAEEVRNLAKKSSEAARETNGIVEANISLSGKGAAVVERVQTVLNEITLQTNKVNELMAEIAAASQEQTHGANEISQSMSQISVITQQNAANAEESAAAAEELNAQANSMKKIVHELSELINGKTAALKLELAYSNLEVHHLNHQTTSSHEPLDSNSQIISPEDIIPLEKDPHHF